MSQETKTVNFTPVTVTVETLQILAKQANYLELAGLYIAYVEVATWQDTSSVYATNSFMATRVGCGIGKLKSLRAELSKLGLVSSVRRTNASGKVVKHFILVNHYYNENQKVDFRPSGNKNQKVGLTTSGEIDPQVLHTSSLSASYLQQQGTDVINQENMGTAAQPKTADPTTSLQGRAEGSLQPLAKQVVDVATPNQETGGLTKQQEYVKGEKEEIERLGKILGDTLPRVKPGVLPEILDTIPMERLEKGLRYYADQFDKNKSMNDYWVSAPGMKRLSYFFGSNKNGNPRYEDMIVAAEAVKRKGMF